MRCTCNLENDFVYSFHGSRPLKCWEEQRRCGLTAPPGGSRCNDNVIMSHTIMFTLLLLINNVDDGVNKGYCGIVLAAEWFFFVWTLILKGWVINRKQCWNTDFISQNTSWWLMCWIEGHSKQPSEVCGDLKCIVFIRVQSSRVDQGLLVPSSLRRMSCRKYIGTVIHDSL